MQNFLKNILRRRRSCIANKNQAYTAAKPELPGLRIWTYGSLFYKTDGQFHHFFKKTSLKATNTYICKEEKPFAG